MRSTYSLFLNGKFYGSGPLSYMHELITDYFRHGLYGKEIVEFKIVKNEKMENKDDEIQEAILKNRKRVHEIDTRYGLKRR